MLSLRISWRGCRRLAAWHPCRLLLLLRRSRVLLEDRIVVDGGVLERSPDQVLELAGELVVRHAGTIAVELAVCTT
eukprot:696966-Prorocentrum_minimum.AAC.1